MDTALPPPSRAIRIEDARIRTRDDWLIRTERDFAAARVIAEVPACPNCPAVIKHLQAMLDAAADAECLTALDRERLANQARAIARIAYQRAFEGVLENGHALMRGESAGRLDRLLAEAERLMDKLKRLQLDAATHVGLRHKLDILLDTSRRGDSLKAKPREAIETKPFVRDQRLFVRYRQPVVRVQIGNLRYRTVNWSLGGLLLADVAQRPGGVGALLEVGFWIEGGRRHEEQATVMRYEAAAAQLALKLRRFGSATVTLKQECEQRGLAPRP